MYIRPIMRSDTGNPWLGLALAALVGLAAFAFYAPSIGYGFAPLQLPADLDFPAMFHGVDERVPLDALVFGRRVLGDLLLTY